MQAQQSPSAQRRTHLAVSAAADNDGAAACCRICLDPLCPQDTDTVRLACRCSTSGFDAMHRACAAQWFGPRKSTTCEVCSAEAVGLPQEIKAQIRLSQLALAPPQQRPLAGLRSFTSVPAFLAAYFVFCLLPAAIVSLSLAFFFINMLAADIVTGMSLSIALATSTILHWICFPQRPCLHACFVVVTLGCSIACSLLAATIFPSWATEMQIIVGALSGFLIGALVFYIIVLPVGLLLARCLNSQGALYMCCMQCRQSLLLRARGAASVDIERAAAFSQARPASAESPAASAHAAAAMGSSAPPHCEAHSAASGGLAMAMVVGPSSRALCNPPQQPPPNMHPEPDVTTRGSDHHLPQHQHQSR